MSAFCFSRAGSKGKRATRFFRFALAVVCCLGFASPPLPAEESSAEPVAEEALYRVIDGRFRWPPISEVLTNSETAAVVPAAVTPDSFRFLDQTELDRLAERGIDLPAVAEANAARLLEETEPEYLREENGVLAAAVLETELPVAGALPLAEGFHEAFQDLFGPEFLLALPSRFKLYVFPKHASRFEAFAPIVLSEYRVTGQRVSSEVFEVDAESIRAVGRYDDR